MSIKLFCNFLILRNAYWIPWLIFENVFVLRDLSKRSVKSEHKSDLLKIANSEFLYVRPRVNPKCPGAIGLIAWVEFCQKLMKNYQIKIYCRTVVIQNCSVFNIIWKILAPEELLWQLKALRNPRIQNYWS